MQRARYYLDNIPGGVGAYSESKGAVVLRKEVAKVRRAVNMRAMHEVGDSCRPQAADSVLCCGKLGIPTDHSGCLMCLRTPIHLDACRA